ncbi:amidohydrolase family protein [Neolewinella persica]|uniref:amidohydrolase family protein n=1 Tax=Neolewinella persica TaxID=70998 RepID=UPI0005C4B2BF|nr:amidohydrolase family protein [Neolewinella persica]
MRLLKQWPLLAILFVLLTTALTAQKTYPYNGVYDQREGHYAFTGATVHVSPEQMVKNATLVIRDGKVVGVSAGGAVPAGAVEVKLDGKHVYPSFIEAYGSYGMPEVKSGGGGWGDPPQTDSKTPGAFSWNQAMKSEVDAAEQFTIDKKAAKALRDIGFGTVSTHQPDGISRGSAAVVSLGETSANDVILKRNVAHHLSFSKGSSRQNYPSSRMGTMALLRQAYHDGQWYKKQKGEETNLSIEAWNALQDMPQIFDPGGNWQDALRADMIGDEFGKQYILVGGGDEYERLDALKASGATFLLPLKFPEAYDLGDPFAADLINLGQLRHWERAPGNMAAVAKAGIPFVLTTNGHKKMSDFTDALRKAVEVGADAKAAFAALTTGPAKLLGIDGMVGTLDKGKLANFIVTDKDFFTEKATIYQNWVQGEPFALKDLDVVTLAEGYSITVDGKAFDAKVSGEAGSQKMKVMPAGDSTGVDVTMSTDNDMITLRFLLKGADGFYRLVGTPAKDGGYIGTGRDPMGKVVSFTASPKAMDDKEAADKKDDKKGEEEDDSYVSRLTYPNIAYGADAGALKAGTYLIRNATVWTNEDAGILQATDVLISNGRITGVGKNLSAAGATVIDGKGMHVTAGIIDEHSHIALSSVNEGSQVSSAEVRMNDVIDANDINIYRQLAGGVTTSQLLHGSANPIGGQSALIKLRWGKTPEEMKFKGADGFIKFALGENVKQSNWGDLYRDRYPQTRMGVEQVFESYFSQAKEYGEAMKAGKLVRKDLDLEALLEILNSERFITCHSYQQGEINMLMKVADRHNFKVNTFTHILEGYKVADQMAKHGAAGSTFSDWWAYKYEVNEAIPYNGALMHEQGVLTGFNSDDAEMARRLNQEAGKAVLFGGVSEEEALKFVTLNPAKMLHIDDRVGSIKTGKDADVVVWNNHPLSIYARAEHTFVDGVEYFNRAKDAELRKGIQEERNALVQKSLDAKKAGAKTQAPKGKKRRMLHCNSLDHRMENHEH